MMAGISTFLLPILVAGAVWYFTGSEIWGGITFTVFWIAAFIRLARKFEQISDEKPTPVTKTSVRRQQWILRIIIWAAWVGVWPTIDRIFPDHPQYWYWISLPIILALGFLGEDLEAKEQRHKIANEQLKDIGPGLAKDLEDLLEGKTSAKEFRTKFHALPNELVIVLGDLEHYLCDEDIRLKDPRYADMQNGELKKMIELIKSGASTKRIERIHFLGRT